MRVAHLCWLLSLTTVAVAQDAQPLAGIAELMRQLGWPDPADKPFVRAWTGRCYRLGVEDWQQDPCHGIVVADDGRAFTVLTEYGRRERLERTPAGTPAARRIAFEPVELTGFVEASVLPGAATQGVVRLGILAWIAKAQGQPGIAGRLVEAMAGGRGQDPLAAFTAALGNDEANGWLLAFADTALGHAQIEAGIATWLQVFPGHAMAERMRELHAATAAVRTTPPPVGDEIAALIHRLPEHRGGPAFDDDPPALLDGDDDDSSAAQLLRIGVPAVPALAAALTDRRPVRAYYCDDHGVVVMRVGEVVRQILGEIHGEPFAREPAAAQAEVERWLRDVRARGEVAILRERIEQGWQSAGRSAWRLARVGPAELLPAVRAGWTRTDEFWLRGEFVNALASVDGADVRQFLLERLSDPDLRLVVRAGDRLLLTADRARALAVLAERWVTLSSAEAGPIGELAALLVRHGDAAVFAALARHPERLTGQALAEIGWRHAGQPDDAATELARERLLGQALARTATRSLEEPRDCDHAARALANRWPQHYRFDSELTRPDRDRLLHGVRSAFLVRQGQPALPPLPAVVLPAPPPDLAEVLDRWRREDVAAVRERMLAAVDGIGAVPRLRELAAAAAGERRDELERTIARLAATVVAIEPAAALAALPEPLRAAFAGLQGKPMTRAALLAVHEQLLATPSPIASCTWTVLRATDEVGLRLHVDVTMRGDTDVRSLQRNEHVRAGQRCLANSFGAGQRTAYLHDVDFVDALLQAIDVLGVPAIEAELRLVMS